MTIMPNGFIEYSLSTAEPELSDENETTLYKGGPDR